MPSLLEAIDNKYGEEKNKMLVLDLPIKIYAPKESPRNLIPTLLVLNDCDIDSAGDESELKRKCEGVEELDLAQNKLSRWNEVFEILKHMTNVKFVNLSFNDLQEELLIVGSNPYPYLKNLVLNGTNIRWESIRILVRCSPSLEELHLSLNGYTNVEWPEDEKPHNVLRKLHLTGNPLSAWDEVQRLDVVFPVLELLVLAECPLRTVRLQDPGFTHLRFLNLNNTCLSSWCDVDHLRSFPKMHSLRILGCPLFESPQEYTEHERRQLLIARLPNITMLNGGGTITSEEREDAERAFIRHYLETPDSQRPRRFHELVATHGMLRPLVDVDLGKVRQVRVKVTCGDDTETRKLSLGQTVQQLKKRLEDFASTPAERMRLFYVNKRAKTLSKPEEMTFPEKQLLSYNVCSKGEIIVQCRKNTSS